MGFWAKRWFAEAGGYSWVERGAVPLFPEVFGSVMLVGRQGFPEAFCSHQGGLFGGVLAPHLGLLLPHLLCGGCHFSIMVSLLNN